MALTQNSPPKTTFSRRIDRIPGPLETHLFRLLLLCGFAAMLFARMPQVLYGRFWAEEGLIFFPLAATLPWWSALLHSYGGYLNIVVNAATVLAYHTVRLEDAPYVTTAIGLGFQCFPAIILLYSRDAWLQSPWTKLAALLILATPPMVGEVWLQSLHSQFHLALACAIILALDIPTLGMAWFFGVILFIAPLCGPAGASLLPLLIARAGFERSWRRFFQALILAIGTFVQFAFFYSHQAGRAYRLHPLPLLCDVYLRQIIAPFAGEQAGDFESSLIQARLAAHLLPWHAILVTLGIVPVLGLALWRRGNAGFVWLFLAAGLTTLVCYFGAFDTGTTLMSVAVEGRYTFLPQMLAALVLLGLATGTRPERWIARLLVVWQIAIGVLYISGYPTILGPEWTVHWIYYGPDWHSEVATWRQNPSHALGVWPTGYTMHLPAAK